MGQLIYQHHYSKLHGGRALNEKSRFRKAEQIITIINEFNDHHINADMKQWSVLDIGCSSGMVDFYLADNFKCIYGIDLDPEAIDLAKREYAKDNTTYSCTNIDEISIENKFELIICNSVFEHVPDQNKLMNSIFKLLKPDGICFLSVPNKFTIAKEPHYDLYLLSWFPQNISNLYLKLIGRGSCYYENPPSYRKLLRLCKEFLVYDYTIDRIRYPRKYKVEFRIKNNSIISKLPYPLMVVLRLISPSFVFILKKPDD